MGKEKEEKDSMRGGREWRRRWLSRKPLRGEEQAASSITSKYSSQEALVQNTPPPCQGSTSPTPEGNKGKGLDLCDGGIHSVKS